METTAIATLKDNDPLIEIQEFQKKLNEQPPADKIAINKMAKNSKYLPIDYIESLLDSQYVGLWKTSGFKTQVIANEIVGEIQLEVFHPEARMWISRTGAAGTLIKQHRDAPITDISKKIKNTLVTDYPHLKAECIKNAAKSLGKAFGRSLNRELSSEFEAEYSDQSDIDMLYERIEAMENTTARGEAVVIQGIANQRLSKQDQVKIKLALQDKINRLVKNSMVK